MRLKNNAWLIRLKNKIQLCVDDGKHVTDAETESKEVNQTQPPEGNAGCIYTSDSRIHARSGRRHEACHYISLQKVSHQELTVTVYTYKYVRSKHWCI